MIDGSRPSPLASCVVDGHPLIEENAAVNDAKAVTRISHKGIKGQLREIVIRDLFRPLLPADVGVGTGEIISADNRHSREQDVVIYDRQILPPFLLEQSKGIFPIECVLYTVEVKSRLSAQKLKISHESATDLASFHYQSGEYDENDKPIVHTVNKLISTILAFSSDLTYGGKTEIQRYEELYSSGFPFIQAICLVGRGYWYWYRDRWITWKPSYPFEEVISFIAGVMNTYRKIAATRKEPRLGRYLMDK